MLRPDSAWWQWSGIRDGNLNANLFPFAGSICNNRPEHRSWTLVQGGHPPRPLNCRRRLHEEVHPHARRPRRQSFFDYRLAEYSGDEERRKSVTGMLIFAFGSLVYWRSKRISAITPGSPMSRESEYLLYAHNEMYGQVTVTQGSPYISNAVTHLRYMFWRANFLKAVQISPDFGFLGGLCA
jgi:hypothetical protein